MMSARFASDVALASSSAKNGQCSPVVASTSTIGESGVSDRPMSVIGGAPLAARSTPGNVARIMAPGLKPSFVFQSAGSMWTPATFAVSDAALRFTRRPVSVVESRVVNQSLGKGSAHRLWPRKSHRLASVASTAGSHETVAIASCCCEWCHDRRAVAMMRLSPGVRSTAVSVVAYPRDVEWSRPVRSTARWSPVESRTRKVDGARWWSSRTSTPRVPSAGTWVRSPGARMLIAESCSPPPCGNHREQPASATPSRPITNNEQTSFGRSMPIPPNLAEPCRPYRRGAFR